MLLQLVKSTMKKFNTNFIQTTNINNVGGIVSGQQYCPVAILQTAGESLWPLCLAARASDNVIQWQEFWLSGLAARANGGVVQGRKPMVGGRGMRAHPAAPGSNPGPFKTMVQLYGLRVDALMPVPWITSYPFLFLHLCHRSGGSPHCLFRSRSKASSLICSNSITLGLYW